MTDVKDWDEGVPASGAGVPRPSRRRLVWYLLPVVALPVLLIVAAFFIIPSDWFTLRSGSSYLANFAYADTLHQRSCQVLIYGDSSAMVGVSPAAITARTGLSACNIAEFEGMTLMTHTLLLDHFLANNPRPRFLLFLYTPDDLTVPNDWGPVSTFEATSYLVRHDPGWHTAVLLATHPANTFGWAEQGLRMTAQRLHARPFGPEVLRLREENAGQLHMQGSTLTACDPTHHLRAPDPAWVNSLRQKYGVDGTTVLVDATPAPTCDPDLETYRVQLNRVINNWPYEPLPIDSFTDDGRLHANALGAERISKLVADQIAGEIASAPPAPQGGR